MPRKGSVDHEPSGVVPDGVVTPVDTVRRPTRIAGKTFATQGTVFTANSRIFGEVLLRTDHGAEPKLTPLETIAYIRAVVRYAKLSGRINLLVEQLKKWEEVISATNADHPGLRGAELQRLGVSVTEVPEVGIKPDVKAVRTAAGSAFPKYGTEEVIATITVPEEPQPLGTVVSGDEVENYLRAAFLAMGMSDEAIETNTEIVRRMNVTDREELLRAVNEGLIPESAVKPKVTKKIKVLPLIKEKPKRTRKKADDASQDAIS